MTTCNRRRFLSQSARAGAAALIAPLLPGLVQALPLGGPAGIQLYAVKDSLAADPAATLRRIRAIGFGEVETAGLAGLSARDFRRLLDDNGLVAPSAHLDFTDPGAAFDQAHALGAHYAASGSLRAFIPEAHAGGMSLEEAQRTAALASRLGEQARRAGLQYVYHNHNFEFAPQAGGAIGYDLLLKESDPALVQFEIDCGWMAIGRRDPRDYFRRYPQRFPMIHVKDFLPAAAREGGAGATSEYPGAELGHGMIDYGPIFAAAEKAGLRHYFAEQEGPFTRMTQLEAARQAFDYLERMS